MALAFDVAMSHGPVPDISLLQCGLKSTYKVIIKVKRVPQVAEDDHVFFVVVVMQSLLSRTCVLLFSSNFLSGGCWSVSAVLYVALSLPEVTSSIS